MNDNGTMPMPPASVAAARLSIVGGAVFVVALAFLHILKPEVDVWSQMISEYAIVRYGWLMTLAFLAVGAGCTAFIVAIRPWVPGKAGVAGLTLLGIAAVGLVIAGLFTTDPAAAEVELTTEGQLHVLGAGLGTGLFLGLALLTWRLRRVSEWGSARRRATVLTVVAWLAYLSFSAAMGASSTGDMDAGIGGIPNRLRMIAFCAWMIVVARDSARLRHAFIGTLPAGSTRRSDVMPRTPGTERFQGGLRASATDCVSRS